MAYDSGFSRFSETPDPEGRDRFQVYYFNNDQSILEQNANKRIYKFISKHLWRFDIKTAKLSFPWKRMFEVKVDVSLNYANQSLLYKTKGW